MTQDVGAQNSLLAAHVARCIPGSLTPNGRTTPRVLFGEYEHIWEFPYIGGPF